MADLSIQLGNVQIASAAVHVPIVRFGSSVHPNGGIRFGSAEAPNITLSSSLSIQLSDTVMTSAAAVDAAANLAIQLGNVVVSSSATGMPIPVLRFGSSVHPSGGLRFGLASEPTATSDAALSVQLENTISASTATVNTIASLSVQLENTTSASTATVSTLASLSVQLDDTTTSSTAAINTLASLSTQLSNTQISSAAKRLEKVTLGVQLDNVQVASTLVRLEKSNLEAQLAGAQVISSSIVYYDFTPKIEGEKQQVIVMNGGMLAMYRGNSNLSIVTRRNFIA